MKLTNGKCIIIPLDVYKRQTVDREKAQAHRRDAIEMTVRIRHELIRLLRRCVETDGMVDIVCRREGRLLLVAVNRRARCKEKMLYLVMAAGFKNIEEADDVGIDIRARMVNAVPVSYTHLDVYKRQQQFAVIYDAI